jgi:hypothetical protein
MLGMPAVTPASAGPADAWMSVTAAQVNKLGGVHVVGLVDCSAMARSIRLGEFTYQEEDGTEVPLILDLGDLINLYANSDNYTVSQPAGRKTMINVTHGSSQMSPCYVESFEFVDGDIADCEPEGAPCVWATNVFGYNEDEFGPLFDYSDDGKFKTGAMNVSAHSIGLLVEVIHTPQSPVTRDVFYRQEGTWATTSGIVYATAYRR